MLTLKMLKTWVVFFMGVCIIIICSTVNLWGGKCIYCHKHDLLYIGMARHIAPNPNNEILAYWSYSKKWNNILLCSGSIVVPLP